jgi:eukaryotic-like serine/threonine-protein kinase
MTATALCGQALVAASLSSASTLSPQDKILLVSFTNSTKDGDFDDSLKEALRTALEGSPFLNIIPEATLAGAMKEMGRDKNEPLTLELARQLGQQVGSRAYLVGSISKQGSEFALALEATDCMSGKTLAREQSIAQNKEKVLDVLGKVASDLRMHLGESLASVQKFNTPLSTATTSSLEALQAWALGLRIKQEKEPAEAIAALENATKLDLDFASALFDLGLIYRNSQQEILARNLFIKAFAARSHATTRKRFSIEGMYYSFVTVDYDKTVETYRQWMRIYPRDERPVSNLGSFYGDVCEYQKAIAQFKKARRMNPKNYIVHEDLIELLTAAGEFEKAREAYSEMVQMRLDDDAPHVYMYAVAFLEHDAKEMANQAGWFTLKPDFQHEILSEQADAEAYDGHLTRARELTTQAVQSALSAHNNEQAAAWLFNAAWREDLFGNIREAHDQAVRALQLAPDSREGSAIAAILFARTGDVPRATTVAEELGKRYPDHPVVQSYWLPCIRAQVALAQKDPARALQLLRTAARYDTLLPQVAYYSHMPSVVLRAEAYSATAQPALAAKEWETILKTPGIVQLSASAPIARLQLARIYACEPATGSASARAKARIAYQDFLSLWQEADADVPVLREARQEFAKLRQG